MYEHAITLDEPREVLRYYRNAVRRLHTMRKKLKNPINRKTGKALKPATLKQYQKSIASEERKMKVYKYEIKILILYGYIGKRTRAVWIRKFIKSNQNKDYLKGLTKFEKQFVEAYRGNAILAMRKAGVRGCYKHVAPKAKKYLKKPQIASALSLKYSQRILGLRVIIGDGNGNSKPFMCRPDEIKHTKCIPLKSYTTDIRNRLDERRERLWAKNNDIECIRAQLDILKGALKWLTRA